MRLGKILFIMSDLGGGTGNHLLSMMRYWGGSTLEAEIVLCGTKQTSRIESPVPVVPLRNFKRWYNRYPISQAQQFRELLGHVSEYKPEIVHAYFFWPILFGRMLKKMGRIRILVENREDQGFNWGRHEYTLLRATSSLPDRVVCVCDAVRQVALGREGLDEERVVVIRNGVEPTVEEGTREGATRADFGLRADDLVVGMVANYNRSVKGVSYLLDAIPAIVSEVPSSRFLLLGRGVREGTALRDKTRALGIERFVTFTGYRSDVHGFYEMMDISVLTSLSEGLSITLLESMSHGLPVVATNVGGNPELVLDGRTGYLVPPKDACSLADKIIRLLRDPGLRIRMGEEGRRHVERNFQMRDVANRYLDLYRDVIGR